MSEMMAGDKSRKILPLEQVVELRRLARLEGRRVVHCHGCFDIVHPGHIRHLRYARSLGDILLVSITGDVQMRKGAGRPLIPEELRADNLAELDCVTWVAIDPNETARELLEAVQPDVYVKGQEYEANRDPRFQAERETVERFGGRVVFSSGDVVFSSTALIGSIENSIDPASSRLKNLLNKPGLDGAELFRLIAGFRNKRVVIVGETIRDTYVFCDRAQVASESPILTLRPLERRHYDGGAAIIATHVAAMGGHPILVTPLPETAEGVQMRSRLAAAGVEVRSIPSNVPIPAKERMLVGTQKVVKLDMVERIVLDATRQRSLIAAVSAAGREGCDAAILADFGLGLFTPTVTEQLCAALRPITGILAGDVSNRHSHLMSMRGMDLLTPSEDELRDAVGVFDQSLPAAAWNLLDRTGSTAAIVKMGADGLVAFDKQLETSLQSDPGSGRLKAEHVPALAPNAVDPLGAGDALLATATLALAAGGSLVQAAFLGSAAAAIESQRLGNLTVSQAELRRIVTRLHTAQLAFVAEGRALPTLKSSIEGRHEPATAA